MQHALSETKEQGYAYDNITCINRNPTYNT